MTSRLPRAFAINAVIAWLIQVPAPLGSQGPDCGPKRMFIDDELSFLKRYGWEFNLNLSTELGNAARLVIDLGGYRGRMQDLELENRIMGFGPRNFRERVRDIDTAMTLSLQRCSG